MTTATGAQPITKTEPGLNVPSKPNIPFTAGDEIGDDDWSGRDRDGG